MSTYLITGANRGIGFAYVKQLLQNPSNKVIVVVRNDASTKAFAELDQSNLKFLFVDMGGKVSEFKEEFKKLDLYAPNGVDIVIHNAGISGPNFFVKSTEYDVESALPVVAINYLGTVKLYQAVYPYLFKGNGTKKLILTSSLASSMGQMPFGSNTYGASKAAVNHFGVQIATEHQNSDNPLIKNSITVLLHPGLVLTDMAAMEGDSGSSDTTPSCELITPDVSAKGTLDLVARLTSKDNGKFFDYQGNNISL